MVTSGQSVNESQRHKNGCSLAVVCPCFHTVEFCCNLCGLCTQERQLITVFTLKSHSSQTVFTLKRHSSQLSLHSRDTAHNCLYTQETQLTTVFTLKRHSSQLSLHSRDTAHNCLYTQETQLTTVFTLKRHSSQLSLHSRDTAHNCLYTQETQLTIVFTLKRHSSQLSLHSRDTAHNCLYTQETQLTIVFTLKRHSSQLSLHSLTMQPGVCLGVYIHDEAKWSLLSINQNVLHMYCNSFCFGPPEYDSFRLPNKEQKKVVGFSFSSQTMSSLI